MLSRALGSGDRLASLSYLVLTPGRFSSHLYVQLSMNGMRSSAMGWPHLMDQRSSFSGCPLYASSHASKLFFTTWRSPVNQDRDGRSRWACHSN